ncbi:LysR family transcriptional regulator [Nesterenkonia marinintestina]|uniref:LysR family transcriptional regulator n=1 Tax=Nesterenkonia marinintestina TaxID=2979865 RepID=UPI0021C00911|nr:LysR family transcriptional regulator [Nesterenkonia sp. GX14115]
MTFDLRDVALVVAVADHGSITEGARALGLSLSAASSRITALEKSRGVNLLIRSRRGVVPTSAGADFIVRGGQLLAQAEGLVDMLRHHRDGQADHVRMASNTSAADALTEFLAAALSRFPKLRVVLDEVPSEEVARRVRDGDADLGVVSLLDSEAGLAVHPLWGDPLVIVGAPLRGASDDASPTLTFEEVIRGPMIGLTEGSPLQVFVDEQATRLGIDIDYRLRLPSLGAVYDVATTGAGTAILPLGTARRLGAPDEAVHGMPESWTQRRAMLLIRSDRSASSSGDPFVEAMLRYRNEPRD